MEKMKKILSVLRYFLLVCLVLILCYSILKKDLHLICVPGFFCAFWITFLAYERIHEKNKAIGVGLLTLSGLFLILSIITFFGL